MARQITPSAPSLPPTSAISDPAARSFAAAVGEVLRVMRASSQTAGSGGLTEAQVRKIVADALPRGGTQAGAAVTPSAGVARTYEPADPRLQMHLIDTSNPHATTAEQIGAVAGPASAVDGHVVVFDGATGKAIKDTGLTLSGTNTGDETALTLGATTHGAAEATGLISSDELSFIDTTAAPVLKRVTWANFRASVKAYLDSFYAAIGAITGSGLTMASGKLLGRSTAANGAVEEIALGTGLTLSDGVLSAAGGGGGGGKYTIGASWSGAGQAINAATADVVVRHIPVAGTITKWVVFGETTSGSCQIDIWKDSYANFPPTIAGTITAAAKPSISGAQAGQSSTLTGWTTTVAAGDVLLFKLDSSTGFKTISIFVEITP